MAIALLTAPGSAETDATPDVVARFEFQAPEPSTSGEIFARTGIAETLVNADAVRAEPGHCGRVLPALLQWFGDLSRLDFGNSLVTGQPAWRKSPASWAPRCRWLWLRLWRRC